MNDDVIADERENEAIVRELRQRLAPLAFDGRRAPDWSEAVLLEARFNALRRRRLATLFATAALLAIATGAGLFLQWRLRWPEDAAWPVRSGAPLSVGASRAVVQEPLRGAVARLGAFDAAVGTHLTLMSTGTSRHDVRVGRGTFGVRLWSPPGRFRVHTPAGEIVDLGCAFRVAVSETGASFVRVSSGWVRLTNPFGETLVPAGASSEMRAGSRALVPVFDDAAEEFRAAVRGLEGGEQRLAGNVGLDEGLSQARPRDVYTLLMLTDRLPAAARARVVALAAQLTPPPSEVNLAAVAAGDREHLWRWADALPLPAVKSWWRNWRDGLAVFGGLSEW